jgi:hypothetical protein
MLLIAGGADHTLPAVVDRQTAGDDAKSKAMAYTASAFWGRSHFTIAEPGGEVGDYASSSEDSSGTDATGADTPAKHASGVVDVPVSDTEVSPGTVVANAYPQLVST